MDNTDTKTNSETKTQKDDLPTNNLRDPNIILPQSRRNIKPASTSGPIDMQKKTDPVMLRSFNKDISEAMAKKKSLVSVKDAKIPKVPKTPKISPPHTPKVPTAPASFLKKPVGSTGPNKGVPTVQKTADEIKIKTKPIPPAPIPESVAVKKEEIHIPQTPKRVDVKPQFDDKKEKPIKRKDFSSEIFPKPPQTTRTGEQEFIKKVALSQQKSGVADQDVRKNQELRDDFDRMIHGEHDNDQDISQIKKLAKTTTQKTLSQQEGKKNEKEIKPALSKMVVNIHISVDDLKKLKEEILNIEAEEKELQSKLQEITKEEITLTEEENREEAEKNLAKRQLDDILLQEKEIESMIREIEQQEKEAKEADERHNVETKRWAQEEKRVQIEKNKWDIGEKYEKSTASLNEKKIKLEQIKSSKDELSKRMVVLLEKKKGKEIEVHLGEMERKKEEIENIQMTLLEEKKGIDKTLALLKENKQKVIEERIVAEENEKRVEAMSEKRIFEEKRQNMEIRQRSIEQQRWEAEQKLEQIIKKIKNTNEQYKVTTSMEEEIRKKLQ